MEIMVYVYIVLGLSLLILVVSFASRRVVVRTELYSEKTRDGMVFYYLPESIIRIKASVKVAVAYDAGNKIITTSTCLVEETFSVTSEVIADTDCPLLLRYSPNWFTTDEIKPVVNSKGLLESVNVTTDDRTAEVISRIGEAPQKILGTSQDAGAAAPAKAIATVNKVVAVKIKEYTADFVLKASDANDKPIKWPLVIYNEMGVDELPHAWKADFSITLSFPSNEKAFHKVLPFPSNDPENSKISGIVTRPLINAMLSVRSLSDKPISIPENPLIVSVIDTSRPVVIPIKRRKFAKGVNNVVLQDGIIISNEITNPSSFEGFITIPVDILKAVVSIPAQILKFRYDNTTRLDALEKARLSYEKSVQERTTFDLLKDQEVEKVKLQVKNSELSEKADIINLQTSLVKAEKAQLDARIELEEVKKKLEKMSPKKK